MKTLLLLCPLLVACPRGGNLLETVDGSVPDASTDASTDASPDAPDSGAEPDAIGASCAEDERVQLDECVPCPQGETNEAGDLIGADTQCDDTCILTLGVRCDDFVSGETYIKSPSPSISEGFGEGLAYDSINERLVVAGGLGVARSVAYVFRRVDGAWQAEGELTAPNSEVGDRFGQNVAIDGDFIAVGAHHEDSASVGVDGVEEDDSAENAGAVYVFTRRGDTWEQAAYIKATNTDAGDNFGSSLALQGDTLIVGARSEASASAGVDGSPMNNDLPRAGAVYVLRRSAGVWQHEAYLKADAPAEGHLFGFALALDGDVVAVGAPDIEAMAAPGGVGGTGGGGVVHLFAHQGGAWQPQQRLTAPFPVATDGFGSTVALRGERCAVGAAGENSAARGIDGEDSDESALHAGAVYLFEEDGPTWSQTAYIKASNSGAGDAFGSALALADDTLIVGAYAEDGGGLGVMASDDDSSEDAGAAYVFRIVDDEWREVAYLKASNTDSGDWFGIGVAVSESVIIISALGERSSSPGINGDRTDNEIPYAGAVYARDVRLAR